jgi:hypothetical protein
LKSLLIPDNLKPSNLIPDWTPGKVLKVTIAGVMLLLLAMSAGKLFENVNADEIVVIQSPISGTLTWYTAAGLKWQGWGYVTRYRKSFTYWFSYRPDQGARSDQALKTRFYDGGHAKISGSVRVDLPLDEKSLTALHIRFGSQDAIEHAVVGTVFEKSVYMAGPLMSSKESYAEKRPLLIFYIEDQALHGVYQTTTQDVRMKDPITGVEKTVTLTKIIENPKAPGGMARQEVSPLQEFSLRCYNLAINQITYDPIVEKQILQQQEAIMAVQTAVARAKEAEQDALTAEQRGLANAKKAKWEQEVIKAQQMTEAEQRLGVAEFDRKTAEQRKQESILLGQGEAERRRLVMEADSALEVKIAAWKEVNKYYAEQIGKQRWVPEIQWGGSGQQIPGQAANDLVNLFVINIAKQLGLDMKVREKAN